MTTIAYFAGVLAGDTLLTSGSTKLPEVARKVFRLRDGRLFGSSGNSEDGLVVLDALREDKPTPKTKGTMALLVYPDGRLEFYEGKRWSRVCGADYIALGQGAAYALGAMAHGATAEEAVRIGMKFDTHSGGKVQSVSLHRKKRRRKTG